METVAALVVLGLLAAVLVAVVAAEARCRRASERARLRRRTRLAERDINHVGQQTEEAIVSELLRRGQAGRVVDGEVVEVRDERQRW